MDTEEREAPAQAEPALAPPSTETLATSTLEQAPTIPPSPSAPTQHTQKKTTRITRMIAHGFKSFAKHTEIVFGEHLNCVLGPNGAGKSNVLDALCFVLGKTSSKDLRAEKAGNLVYNGGKSKKPAKQGEVAICFSNNPKVFPYDGDEVRITRIVKQTGQSIYKLNELVVTRREIVELLNSAKIDPDGYNIILQGDVVHLVEMPPTERRVLIEDIAGISLYEEKKKKALSELEKVEQHLKETEIILKERESYLKELKKDRDQALKYKEMNDKIRQNRASYLKIQIDRKGGERTDFDNKLKSTQDELSALQKTAENLKELNVQKQQQLDALTKEIEEKGEVEQVSLNKEVEGLKIDLAKLQSRLDNMKGEIERVSQRRSDLKSSLDDLSKKREQYDADKKEFSKSLEKKEKDLFEVTSKIEQFKQKNNLDDISTIEKKIEEIDRQAEELQKSVHQLRERQHDFIRQKDKVAHELALIDDRMRKVSEVEKENKKQIDDIHHKRQEFKKATLELNKRLDEDSTFAAQLSRLRLTLQKEQEELSKLRARNISIQETTRGDIAIQKILELRSKNEGIFGTIADLGQADQKYALALEIAAGNRIKSIVVENDRVAAECIHYLKQGKLGIASFLPLNKVRPREKDSTLDKVAKSPGAHGFAIDLIDFDPKFENAFSYVFENTIVVDSIDTAVKIGVGKAKFVSLDGDLSERSGAMQGGFRDRKKQGFGFKEKELTQDIEKKESAVLELEESISIHEKKRLENEERITSLRQLKAEIEGEIIKSERSLHLEEGDLSASHTKKKELEEQDMHLEEQMQKSQSEISQSNGDLARLKIEKQKLRNAIMQLNNPALIAELNAFSQKQTELRSEIVHLQAESKNAQKMLDDVTLPELEKVQSVLKQIDKEEVYFTQEMASGKEQQKQKEQLLKEKEKAAAEFYAKFKSLFAKANALKDEMSQNSITVEKKKDEARQVEIRLNTLTLKRAEFSASLATLEDEFAQYEGVVLDLSKSEAELKSEIARFERMREDIGSVNMRALDIYDTVEKQYQELTAKKETLSKEKEDVIALMNEIEGKKKELFMLTFNAINENFVRFFTQLTTKGAEAALVIEDPENPFEAGVRINVKISGSKFLDIRSLSGGEKTLTALAFIFSIQEHEPASFYVLDEVDAALDKHNSERLAQMLKRYSDKAQYIVISHNDGVISAADNLYGVSMNEHGVSQVVSLKV